MTAQLNTNRRGAGMFRFQDVTLPTGVRLRYAAQGDPAGPGIILLHGFTDSWFSWSEVLPRLSPSLNVFALDQRGHGDSDRPDTGYALDDFAGDVLAFMDAVGLGSATVVGHSMGSFVAQRAASIAPQRIERLVLIGSSATYNTAIEELNAAVQDLTDPVPVTFMREFQESTIHRPLAEAFFAGVMAECLKLPARVIRAGAAGLCAEKRWARQERLGMPALLLWGDRDAYFLREDQEALLATLPDASLIVYPETGHALHWEQPQRFVRDLEDFLLNARSTPATRRQPA